MSYDVRGCYQSDDTDLALYRSLAVYLHKQCYVFELHDVLSAVPVRGEAATKLTAAGYAYFTEYYSDVL